MEWRRGRVIGRGSSSIVSTATSSHSDRIFAVKSAQLSQARLLQREQKILSSLRSPRVVGYIGHDVTREDNRSMYNLFMEYVAGGTLIDTIRRNGGRLCESAISCYARQILLGLEYIHSIGVAHCDIKGQNILIGESGAKVADFGCARWQGHDDEIAGPFGGTPMFMAPEVARGEQQGFPADVWALGCTVIEMATGAAPWPDEADPVTVLYRIAYSGESPGIPDFLSMEARDFLSMCLRRDARERWTVKQLLGHRFLVESDNYIEKRIPDFDFIHDFNSPTSILDQAVWSSISESKAPCGMFDGEDRRLERIRRVVSSCAGPTWIEDADWIAVRTDAFLNSQ